MDTDSLPSAPVFAVSLLLFSYLSLAHHSTASASSLSRGSRPPQWAAFILSWLKYACVLAAALSGLALVQSTGTVGWRAASFLALGLLAFLVAVDRAATWVAARYPGWVPSWRRPLPRRNRGTAASGPGGPGDAPPAGLLEREEPAITEAELGSLDHRDREMLRSILRLDVTTAREIMVPRLDMVALAASSTITQAAEEMVQHGHSRLPVYEETIDRILGVVHYRDVLAALARGNPKESLRDLVRPAFIIPETKRLDDLLEELQEKAIQMAIVVDEYGGTEGLVTMEDVLEEIVGEIEDETSSTVEPRVVHLPNGEVLVDAGVTLENVEELLDARISSSDVDTVGGYVYQALGKIPQVGDVVVTDRLRVEVVSVLGRRVRKLRIKRIDGNGSRTVP